MTTDELKKESEEYWFNQPPFTKVRDRVIEAYLAGAEPREKRIAELINLIHAERKRQEQCDDIHLRKIAELEAEVKEWKDKADLWCKTANLKDHNIMINKELEKENAELKADNDARKFAMAMSEKVEKQLREENAELKKEWQEQVQKATDEGYARTLQTMQLTKATEYLRILVQFAKATGLLKDEKIAEVEQFINSDIKEG